jgi:hypothetical protein
MLFVDVLGTAYHIFRPFHWPFSDRENIVLEERRQSRFCGPHRNRTEAKAFQDLNKHIVQELTRKRTCCLWLADVYLGESANTRTYGPPVTMGSSLSARDSKTVFLPGKLTRLYRTGYLAIKDSEGSASNIDTLEALLQMERALCGT